MVQEDTLYILPIPSQFQVHNWNENEHHLDPVFRPLLGILVVPGVREVHSDNYEIERHRLQISKIREERSNIILPEQVGPPVCRGIDPTPILPILTPVDGAGT